MIEDHSTDSASRESESSFTATDITPSVQDPSQEAAGQVDTEAEDQDSVDEEDDQDGTAD